MGFDPDISAAAKADSATGGVIMDNTPKYNTNIWAQISVIPASTRVGAATIATKRYVELVGIPMPRIIQSIATIIKRIIVFPPDATLRIEVM